MQKAKEYLKQSFSVNFEYNVYFSTSIFDLTNKTLSDYFEKNNTQKSSKIIFVIDDGVIKNHPQLMESITAYFDANDKITLIDDFIIIPGGEEAKNNTKHLYNIYEAVNKYGIDRHSYLAAIGGGAILDLAGYAAATAHRGIKHIRIPTTVLSQNDSGIGVKNGINAFGKKNFIGSFCPPMAVFNDDSFLHTLDNRNWRAGIAEAIKVALIKDADFFYWIEDHQYELINGEINAMNYLIKRCAELHMEHISGSDPFEKGSARPLDFGHWSAHKMEQLSNYQILHGEAVAVGIALDTAYSVLTHLLPINEGIRIFELLLTLGFELDYPEAKITSTSSPLLEGLKEFSEHLGGELTIPLLVEIGIIKNVNQIDNLKMVKASSWVNKYAASSNEKRYSNAN